MTTLFNYFPKRLIPLQRNDIKRITSEYAEFDISAFAVMQAGSILTGGQRTIKERRVLHARTEEGEADIPPDGGHSLITLSSFLAKTQTRLSYNNVPAEIRRLLRARLCGAVDGLEPRGAQQMLFTPLSKSCQS